MCQITIRRNTAIACCTLLRGLDTIEAAKYLHGTPHAGSLPVRARLKLGRHGIKAMAQIGQYTIGISRETMLGVDCRRGSSDQHRIGQDALQPYGR